MIEISSATNETTRRYFEASRFVACLLKFKFFSDYTDLLTRRDWLALGLSCKVKIYDEYQPICRIFEPAMEVFLILDGKIAVTKERKKVYNAEVLEGKCMAVMKAGISFGELGVLYQTNRTASCIALTKVTVISLDFKIFQAILGDYIKNLNKTRFENLSKLRIFNGWDRAKLGGLLNHIYVRQPMHSEYIYKTGGDD